MDHDECGNLFGASKSLLEGSGLVQWTGESFVCNDDEDGLERCWKDSFAPEFGRYMAWVWFSVGAENLAKAALACHDEVEKETKCLGYPVYSEETDLASWVDAVLHPRIGAYGSGEARKFEYGTLGCIWNVKLDRLSKKRKITTNRGQWVEGCLQVPCTSDSQSRRSLIRGESAKKGLPSCWRSLRTCVQHTGPSHAGQRDTFSTGPNS